MIWDHDDDKPREECGIVGVFGHPEASLLTALGLHALQHRAFRPIDRPIREMNLMPRARLPLARQHRVLLRPTQDQPCRNVQNAKLQLPERIRCNASGDHVKSPVPPHISFEALSTSIVTS